jgi:uncharacterized phiE125 gp8 family phage protein
MPSILLTPPAAEPVTLAEAKAYLRVEHDDDDGVIAALIAGARIHIEAQTRRALITQTWRLSHDVWPPDGRWAVLPVPASGIVAARVYDRDGVPQAVDLQSFTLDKAAAPAIVAFAPWSLPAPGRPVAGVELDIEVGYGEAGTDVPQPLRQAVQLLLAHWYENRGLIALGQSVAVLPASVAAIVAPYRVVLI